MTADRSTPIGLTRRRILSGLAGVGILGVAGGAGTFAVMSDRSTTRGTFAAGTVELDVSCAGASSNATCSVTDGRVRFGVSDIDRGDSGSMAVDVAVGTNPARVWLATTCPSGGDSLSEAITGTFSGPGFSRSGSLAEIRRALAGGVRLAPHDDGGCLDPSAGPERLELTWQLPDDAPETVAGRSTPFDVLLYAEQCRHVTEADAADSNPFAGNADCEESPTCVVCADENGTKLGSLTLRYLGSSAANVVVVATGGGAGGVGTGGTEIFADEVDPDETFTIDGSDSPTGGDPDWIGPNIYVDDGRGDGDTNASPNGRPNGNGGSGGNAPAGVNIHTSCSVSLAPGDVYGGFEVVSGTTTDGEPLCVPEDDR